MRLASCIAAILCAAASPAFATGAMLCRPSADAADGPALALVVGRGDATAILQARLTHGNDGYVTGADGASPVVSQAWIDEDLLKVDIVDANAETCIARLDARRTGDAYAGTLTLHGRNWHVRCEESG